MHLMSLHDVSVSTLIPMATHTRTHANTRTRTVTLILIVVLCDWSLSSEVLGRCQGNMLHWLLGLRRADIDKNMHIKRGDLFILVLTLSPCSIPRKFIKIRGKQFVETHPAAGTSFQESFSNVFAHVDTGTNINYL